MKDLKITQGDWKVRENSNEYGERLEVYAPSQDGNRTHINIVAKLENYNYTLKKGGGHYSQDFENQQANAKLISQAPKMLEAVKLFNEGWEKFLAKTNIANSFYGAGEIKWMNDIAVLMTSINSKITE